MRKQTINHSESRNCHKIAEAVDKLVMDPTNMQLWRNQVKNMLKRVEDAESSDVWIGLLIDIDPNKDIAVLYTILAFCHDDHLRMNCIFTDKIKAINPKLCTHPNICVYMTRGLDRMLDIYLRYVARDLNSRNKRSTTNGGEQTDIIPRQPLDTTGQKPGAAFVKEPLKELVKAEEENWSKAMTKMRMMTALDIYSYWTFNQFAERHGIRKVGGNRQLWQIRLDKMDQPDREKLERV